MVDERPHHRDETVVGAIAAGHVVLRRVVRRATAGSAAAPIVREAIDPTALHTPHTPRPSGLLESLRDLHGWGPSMHRRNHGQRGEEIAGVHGKLKKRRCGWFPTRSAGHFGLAMIRAMPVILA